MQAHTLYAFNDLDGQKRGRSGLIFLVPKVKTRLMNTESRAESTIFPYNICSIPNN